MNGEAHLVYCYLDFLGFSKFSKEAFLRVNYPNIRVGEVVHAWPLSPDIDGKDVRHLTRLLFYPARGVFAVNNTPRVGAK